MLPSTSPYLEIARKNNIKIETDVSLFFKLSKALIIGVTGTKGKSTTASLIYHILKTKYKEYIFSGQYWCFSIRTFNENKKWRQGYFRTFQL